MNILLWVLLWVYYYEYYYDYIIMSVIMNIIMSIVTNMISFSSFYFNYECYYEYYYEYYYKCDFFFKFLPATSDVLSSRKRDLSRLVCFLLFDDENSGDNVVVVVKLSSCFLFGRPSVGILPSGRSFLVISFFSPLTLTFLCLVFFFEWISIV